MHCRNRELRADALRGQEVVVKAKRGHKHERAFRRALYRNVDAATRAVWELVACREDYDFYSKAPKAKRRLFRSIRRLRRFPDAFAEHASKHFTEYQESWH